MRIEKNGTKIQTVDDWKQSAPPKSGDEHWTDGRSAKECARAWVEALPEAPREVMDLLAGSGRFPEFVLETAEPEALLHFDNYAGPRNADIAVWACDKDGPIAITVEAKADESFDLPVGEVFSDSLETRMEKPSSNRIWRIVSLAETLFGSRGRGGPKIVDLRYQLLTAAAGTLAHAQTTNATRAVLLIHEFVSTATSQRKLDQNSVDLNAFVERLSAGATKRVSPGELYGPYRIGGTPLFPDPPELFIGKAVCHLGEPKE